MRTGLKFKLWLDYLRQKTTFASLLTLQKRHAGQIVPREVWSSFMKNICIEKMTYFFQSKGLEMEPIISAQETLIVRKLPYFSVKLWQQHQQIYVGDVVVLKDPLDSDNHVVRRLAAVEGYEMVSTNEEDEPFVIEGGQCWVVSDNKNLKSAQESKDSRTYGPISVTDIVGRVMYRFRTTDNHGFVVNNKLSMQSDMPVLYAELDSMELMRHQDEESKGSQT